ncbi:MAG: hypothetical protein LUG19_07830 [Desulfovibrio sp.]|uniref:hypothetical protein n=1 Tax=Desulfovibrio sp. TaxID=885 RepID=UPI002587EC03|nr:hypothetical protein [Desulfovibrio sp.]MCD7984145.1 hypothetical protein [Desulfovibrio sp.]
MFGLSKSLFGLGENALDKVFPDRAASREAQARINEAEVSGAPASRLRLWRSFLGWVLSLGFAWELVRPVVLHYWPGADLPPSMAKEITTLLLGMLGLGF